LSDVPLTRTRIANVMLKDPNGNLPADTAVFELDGQLSLHRRVEHGKEHYLRLLEYRIRRNPQDLLRHAQRIFQCLTPESREKLLGALTDLFIALGEHGKAFRARMLAAARPWLGEEEYRYFVPYLERGMRPCQARFTRHSALAAGYEADNVEAGCEDAPGEGTPSGVGEARSPQTQPDFVHKMAADGKLAAPFHSSSGVR